MKTAGDPVLQKVAAILRPTCPDFPIPATTILPESMSNNSTALVNSWSKRSAAFCIEAASVARAFRAKSKSVSIFNRFLVPLHRNNISELIFLLAKTNPYHKQFALDNSRKFCCNSNMKRACKEQTVECLGFRLCCS